MARKYTMRSKEEKLSIVKRNLAGESAMSLSREIGSSDFQIRSWVKIYLSEGETGLEPKKKPGNPLSRYERRKELTYDEQLQYQIELLKRELVKKEAEVLRLKKLNERKGGDARKR
jgi:transposase-like protein